MSTSVVYCGNCGTEIDSSARFCRKCGHPSAAFEAAPTERFDANPQGAQTGPTNFAPTGHAYVPPAPMYAPASNTQGLQPSSKKPIIVLLAVVAAILMIGAVAFMAVLLGIGPFHRTPTPLSGPPSVSIPQPPVVPPPGVPAPPGTGPAESDGSLQAYIYPGSVKTMAVTGNGKNVIQLTTTDPVERVAEWYRAKLKPSKSVTVPFGVATVLEGKDVKAIITGTGGGTMIMLTKGGGDNDF